MAYKMLASNGTLVAAWEHVYILRKLDGNWRVSLTIADDEMSAWATAGAEFQKRTLALKNRTRAKTALPPSMVTRAAVGSAEQRGHRLFTLEPLAIADGRQRRSSSPWITVQHPQFGSKCLIALTASLRLQRGHAPLQPSCRHLPQQMSLRTYPQRKTT